MFGSIKQGIKQFFGADFIAQDAGGFSNIIS